MPKPRTTHPATQEQSHTSFGLNGSCPDCETEKSQRLTDEECDFIIQRLLWKLRDTTSPIDFFREMKRAVLFEVVPDSKARARDLVRLFCRGDG